jgi:hypothetical protein
VFDISRYDLPLQLAKTSRSDNHHGRFEVVDKVCRYKSALITGILPSRLTKQHVTRILRMDSLTRYRHIEHRPLKQARDLSSERRGSRLSFSLDAQLLGLVDRSVILGVDW